VGRFSQIPRDNSPTKKKVPMEVHALPKNQGLSSLAVGEDKCDTLKKVKTFGQESKGGYIRAQSLTSCRGKRGGQRTVVEREGLLRKKKDGLQSEKKRGGPSKSKEKKINRVEVVTRGNREDKDTAGT